MVLLIVALFTGLIFLGIGLTVSKKNARNVLSGYNSMSPEERKQVKLEPYITFFRYFHFTIGLAIIVSSLVFYFLKLPDYIGLVLIVFILPSYTFFIFRSKYYFPQKQYGVYNFSGFIMLFLSIGVISIVAVLQLTPKVEIFESRLKIGGIYGENIQFQDIQKVELIEVLPTIKLKINGIASANIKKGWFRLNDERKVKLFINDTVGPYVLIETTDKKTIIIGLKDFDDKRLFRQLKLKTK
jgi:hypothetical protein